jgi:hypothetical protein
MKDVPNNVVLTTEPPSEFESDERKRYGASKLYAGEKFFPVNLGFLIIRKKIIM